MTRPLNLFWLTDEPMDWLRPFSRRAMAGCASMTDDC